MNTRFITRIGVPGLLIGLAVSAAGIVTGIVPVIIVGVVLLSLTFLTMQAGWVLPAERSE
jgi:hypothetical protein